jgi:hypothetical protein
MANQERDKDVDDTEDPSNRGTQRGDGERGRNPQRENEGSRGSQGGAGSADRGRTPDRSDESGQGTGRSRGGSPSKRKK